MKSLLWIKSVLGESDDYIGRLIDDVTGIKDARVRKIGSTVMVQNVNRYDSTKTEILDKYHFGKIEEWDFA